MRKLIIKLWRRSLGPWCQKNNSKFKKIEKLEKMQIFLKIADIKIAKTILLHQHSIKSRSYAVT